MAQNFYIVLGVTRDADLDQIRSAYRQLVRQFHPDVSPTTREKFIEVRQAYETLSDPDSRRIHDRELSPRARSRLPAEPVAPMRGPRAVPIRRRRPVQTPFDEMQQMFGAVDEAFDGWVPGFFNLGRQTPRHKDLYVEMILSPQEAAAGGLRQRLGLPWPTMLGELGLVPQKSQEDRPRRHL